MMITVQPKKRGLQVSTRNKWQLKPSNLFLTFLFPSLVHIYLDFKNIAWSDHKNRDGLLVEAEA